MLLQLVGFVILTYEPDSEKIALKSFVYMAYMALFPEGFPFLSLLQNPFYVINKG